MSNNALPFASDYSDWLDSLKNRIKAARQRALLAVNEEQIRLYHEIGTEILQRLDSQGWGAKVIDRLSSDLRDEFPDLKVFAQLCPDIQIGQQPAAQLPWFHVHNSQLRMQ